MITDGELEWLQTSYRCLALSIRTLVARRAEPHSTEEFADLQEEYDKYVKAMEFLHSMLEIMLVRRETYRMRSSLVLEVISTSSTPTPRRSNSVDPTLLLAELSPEDIQKISREEPYKCPICTSTVGQPSLSDSGKPVPAEEYARVPCPFGHVFGRVCIERWIRQEASPDCPLCRHTFLPGLPGNREGSPDVVEGEVESASDNEDEDEPALWWWISILRGDAPLHVFVILEGSI